MTDFKQKLHLVTYVSIKKYFLWIATKKGAGFLCIAVTVGRRKANHWGLVIISFKF